MSFAGPEPDTLDKGKILDPFVRCKRTACFIEMIDHFSKFVAVPVVAKVHNITLVVEVCYRGLFSVPN